MLEEGMRKIIPWRVRFAIKEFFDFKFQREPLEEESWELRFKFPLTKFYLVVLKDFWNISISFADKKELVQSFNLMTWDAVYNIIWTKEFELNDVDNEAHVNKWYKSGR